MEATPLATWEAGYQQPWLLVTDVPPQQACADEYRLRSWIECRNLELKSDGFRWQRTRLTDPFSNSFGFPWQWPNCGS